MRPSPSASSPSPSVVPAVPVPPRPPAVGRRLVARAATLVAVCCAVVGLLAACAPRPTLTDYRRLELRTSLVAFGAWWVAEQAERHAVSPSMVRRWILRPTSRLDDVAARSGTWDLSTDLCSRVPERGATFDFVLPCIRHDFGWRNAGRVAADPAAWLALRRSANLRFLADMRATCAVRPRLQRVSCLAVASAYYLGVSAAT